MMCSLIPKCVSGTGVHLQIWDVRSLKRTGQIKDAHMLPVRDVDFAHQQQHKIVTGGDDCQVCVWDLRYILAQVWHRDSV